MNVDLHIERLVLEGLPVPPAQRPALQASVEAELARLIAVNGPSPAMERGGAVARLMGGPVTWDTAQPPEAMGQGIARAIYGGLGQ